MHPSDSDEASLSLLSTDQRLDLNKLSPNDSDTVRGQIVGEYGRVLISCYHLLLFLSPCVLMHKCKEAPESPEDVF